jgi:hypothetical protein
MADVVTVQHGDTLTKILATKRGLGASQIHGWIDKLRRLNPHISDLNRLYPGERLLIPATWMEPVGPDTIWQNAFSRIPRDLEHPHQGHAELFFAPPGTTIDSVAQRMFAEGRHRTLPLSTKRAVLIHNNPVLEQYLGANRVPCTTLLDITPARLSRFDKHWWQGERQFFASYLEQFDPVTREMYRQAGPEETFVMALMAESLQQAGATVPARNEVNTQKVVNLFGYGIGGLSGYAASGSSAVTQIDTLARELYTEAVEQFGKKVIGSSKQTDLAKVTRFLRANPKYELLLHHLRELPDHLLLPGDRSKLLPPINGANKAALGRHFRKEYFQAFRYQNSSKYMNTIARQLSGRVNTFQAMGRYTTWYIPAIIGAYNVTQASPEERTRAIFQESFGIVGGAFGTYLGGTVIAAGIASVLCLGPFGIFVVAFVLGAAGGIVVSELSKSFGGLVYDVTSGNDLRIYNSVHQILEAY